MLELFGRVFDKSWFVVDDNKLEVFYIYIM